MKKLLLSTLLLLGLTLGAQAQCIAVGGINNVPQPGMVCLSEPVAPTFVATGVGTANPTINDTTPLVVDVQNLFLAATTTSTAMPGVLFDWSNRTFSAAPTLRGVAQQLCVSLNATSPTALINVSFRWTELVQ